MSKRGSGLRVELARGPADLALHEAAWGALAREATGASPLRTPTWFTAHVRHKLAPDVPWLVLCAYDGERLRGVLPVVREASRTLGLGGSRWRVPSEYATEDGDLVLAPGLEGQTLTALLSALAEAAPGSLGVSVGGVRPDSSTIAALGAREPDGAGAEIGVAGSAEAWLRAISENLRINMRKATNRLEREHPGELTTWFLAGADATAELLDDFAALEDAGWKGEDGGALARSPEKLALYRTLAEGWERSGLLEWHVLGLDGRAVAMHLCVRQRRTLSVVRICYDESIARHMPGNLLIKAMVEREHAEGASDTIDFLQARPWNAAWRMRPCPYVRAFLPTAGALPTLLGALPHRARSFLRGLPGMGAVRRRLRGES